MSEVSPEQKKRKQECEDEKDTHKHHKKHKMKQGSEDEEDYTQKFHKKHKRKKSKNRDTCSKEKISRKHSSKHERDTPAPPHKSYNRRSENKQKKHQTKRESDRRKHGSLSPEMSKHSFEDKDKYSRETLKNEESSRESNRDYSQKQRNQSGDSARNVDHGRKTESGSCDDRQRPVRKNEKQSRWSDDTVYREDDGSKAEVGHRSANKNSDHYKPVQYGGEGRRRSRERFEQRDSFIDSDSQRRGQSFQHQISHTLHDDREDNLRLLKSRPHESDITSSQSSKLQGQVTKGGRGEAVPDYDFDFSQHKAALNRIFFRDQDLISRGSKEYEDFWAFLHKYQAYQKKKVQTEGSRCNKAAADPETSPQARILDIPQNYDRRYRINLCLMSREAEDFIKHGRLVDYEIHLDLTRQRVCQFRGILLHYLDFCQKQKFQKLRKIRHDQKNLPIFQYKEKIVSMIQLHQIVVVAGDTGCGKSTQMPQYLLEAGFDKIACTQPRRIACISLAKRVGYETLNEYGSQVAFQVRFEKTKTQATRIVFLTEGLLLRQMSSDQLLSQYSVIVVDEVHERHIHTDFLLGVFKCLLKMRKDLKLVLMSATINIAMFSQYFDNAPVIKVPGRLYPIEMQYCPFNPNNEVYSARPQKLDPTPYMRILQLIDSKYPPSERGDVLIFLSGMTEIMTVVEAAKLYTQQIKRWIILPLHSALSVEEQEKVFDYPPEGVRKCIVSTNIAETSVTIDGVRFVVDSGKVKEMSFDPKYKMQRLKEFWISRASAEQRKGRAGRTGPGVCFRLYAESEYDEFQAYSTPEIQRVPLDSLVLQLIAMGLPNVRKFPFIEPPDMASIENSVRFLKEQGALAADETLTPIGQMLSMLPVDVVIGKMLIMGSVFHMVDPVLSIAAAMSVQSPFTGKAHVDYDAIAARRTLESEHGDPLTLLNAFDEWIQVKTEGRGTKSWCRRRCLEEQRFYEMTKLKRQFRELLQDHHLLEEGVDHRQSFTSEERRQRHGERKRLNQLKREQQHERKKRKVLKIEEEDFAASAGEEDQGEDIKDLEFRLTHDLSQLQERSNRSRSLTLRDINVLKVILCSGIFPQVALADDCNSFKGDSEQAFHTKNKPFILLHPTSVFAYQPKLLKPAPGPSEKHEGPSELRGRLDTRHELLAYGSLLETNNKPYLVNCMRVPALQTLTLFTNAIDTNADCSRLVCDDWLEVRFPDTESAEQVVSSILSLRSTWQHLMQLRLEDTFQSMDENREVSPRAHQLERILSQKLAEFLDSKVPYSIRRILAAEMQHLYVGPGSKAGQSAGMKMFFKAGEEAQEHPVKGGWQINSYLTYNCLLDEASANMWGQYTSHMQRHWTCPHCQQSLIVSVLERLQHEQTCHSNTDTVMAGSVGEMDEDQGSSANPLKKSYHCDVCDRTLKLTATEILKHKRSHSEKKDLESAS